MLLKQYVYYDEVYDEVVCVSPNGLTYLSPKELTYLSPKETDVAPAPEAIVLARQQKVYEDAYWAYVKCTDFEKAELLLNNMVNTIVSTDIVHVTDTVKEPERSKIDFCLMCAQLGIIFAGFIIVVLGITGVI